MNQFWLRSESTGVWPVSGTCMRATWCFLRMRSMVRGSSASETMPWITSVGQCTRFHRSHWSRLCFASTRNACSARTSWR